ncbi:hypothetical protein [Serratia fonticola]
MLKVRFDAETDMEICYMQKMTNWLRKHQLHLIFLYRNKPLHAWGIFTLMAGNAAWGWVTAAFPEWLSDTPESSLIPLVTGSLFTMFSLLMLYTRLNWVNILIADFRRGILMNSEAPVQPCVLEILKFMADSRGIQQQFDAFLACYDEAYPPTTKVAYTTLLTLAEEAKN